MCRLYWNYCTYGRTFGTVIIALYDGAINLAREVQDRIVR